MLISDTIALDSYMESCTPIYSLSVDATIDQPYEASFARVVLEDTKGNNYLVLEYDRFHNDEACVHLVNYSHETAMLPGIVPSRIKFYMGGGAKLHLERINFCERLTDCRMEDIASRSASLLKSQEKAIVQNINAYNERHHRLWRSHLKEEMLSIPRFYHNDSIDAYTENLRYYTDGIYEMGTPSTNSPQSQNRSDIVNTFSWTNRHGFNWMTSVKCQGASAYCTAFAAVSMTEAVTRLYYNRRDDVDLSEQDVAYYAPVNFYLGAPEYYAVNYLCNTGTHSESSTPFQNTPTPTMPSPRPASTTWLSGRICYLASHPSIGEDSVKHDLIKYGPGVAGTSSHYMSLTGFGKITSGMTFTNVDTLGTQTVVYNVSSNDSRIGMTYWQYKNSYPSQPYVYILYHEYWYMRLVQFAMTPIISTQWSDIVCEDRDGDGYFNWGIGPRPSNCPSWAWIEEDGDDNNYSKGVMDANGVIHIIQANSSKYPKTYINTSTTITDNYYHANITVQNNATLTITGNVTCYRGVKLILKSGTTLIIDGGTLKDVILDAKTGSSVIVRNDGSIRCNPSNPFSIPVGVTLQIDSGSVQ